MTSWYTETKRERLARLRESLEQAQDDMAQAEAELAERLAEVEVFEQRFQARLSPLLDQQSQLEAEVKRLEREVQRARSFRAYGKEYLPVEEQYRQTWEVPPQAASDQTEKPLSKADDKQIKRLYRQLARRFHPDLARNDDERAYRTEKMSALNEAYSTRSLVELAALAGEPDGGGSETDKLGLTDTRMIRMLEAELSRIQRRLRQIHFEMDHLHNRPSVRLSLEVKFARRNGRDLLGEIARDLERQIADLKAERDSLRSQLIQLGSDSD